MRRNKEAGAAGIGPGGRPGGTGGTRTPMPVSLLGGPPECAGRSFGLEFKFVFGEFVGHGKRLLPRWERV